jgi:cysteine desulfurase
MRIYLDNNATTPIDPAVLEVLSRASQDVFGNASSIHKEGQAARRLLEEARETVGRTLGAFGRDVVFTSGGTESNNAAIFGAIGATPHGHVVTTAIEHPSVIEAVNDLKNRGSEVTLVGCDRSGRIKSDDVVAAIRPDTQLVTMMLANNETGVVQPVGDVAKVCRERGILMHCDAVQGLGKIAVDVEALQVDLLSVSGHKIHAPKGVGALFVRRGVTLAPHLVGGAQERRRRAGTENVPLAAAFGAAAERASGVEDRQRVEQLRDRFERAVKAGIPDVTVNGAGVPRVPNTSSITFAGADAEGIVIGLDLSGIAVSTGSACSSGRVEPSRVLLAMGLTSDEARSTIRFSLSRFTTAEEIDRVVEVLKEVVARGRA